VGETGRRVGRKLNCIRGEFLESAVNQRHFRHFQFLVQRDTEIELLSGALTMTSPVSQDANAAYIANRFVYSITGKDTFTVDWQISKTATPDWIPADHLVCKRASGSGETAYMDVDRSCNRLIRLQHGCF
jgi:hypothetical protein